ncbi:MAG: sodium ion-translocating decarboxylase subunit beta [Desulfobacteraceae bacterium]|nr:sodium ion-translocating decarboxylase subunit beta [Desulfobacteraceae bacterium]
MEKFFHFVSQTGFSNIEVSSLVMLVIGLFLLYLGIAKKYEPLLLVPIGFGILLVNFPLSPLMVQPENGQPGGLLYYLYMGIELGIYPPLIFMGVGALTDFSPLISNPKTLLLGAAAQIGIFGTFLSMLMLGFTDLEAASIGIIGGADGPTAIYLSSQMAPHLLGAVSVAAYSYMALVPIIQPPIMRLLTTKDERRIVMEELRETTRRERILFPVIGILVTGLFLPESLPLLGMLMLGNLFRECGVVDRLSKAAQNELNNIVVIFLGLTVGAKCTASHFLTFETILILVFGLVAFAIGTATGVLMGKVMCKATGGKVNPLIGAAGVSAVPMSARVCQAVGQKENPSNFLLMFAMGPNVGGVIGSAIAAGIFLAVL